MSTIYELEAVDFVNKPSLIQRIRAFIKGWRYVWHTTQNSWALHRRTKGFVLDGYFVPLPGQSVKYKIVAHDYVMRDLL